MEIELSFCGWWNDFTNYGIRSFREAEEMSVLFIIPLMMEDVADRDEKVWLASASIVSQLIGGEWDKSETPDEKGIEVD